MPLLLSTISHLIYKKKNIDEKEPEEEPEVKPKPVQEPKPEPELEPEEKEAKEEGEENDKEEPQTYAITEGKWEFLWQIPIINAIRNFVLLKELIQAKNEKDEVIVDAKIQNFRIYQIFSQSIPLLVFSMATVIHDQGHITNLGVANETVHNLSIDQLKLNSTISACQVSNGSGFENKSYIDCIDSVSTIGLILAKSTLTMVI